MAGVRRGRSGSTPAGEDSYAKGSGAFGEQWIQRDICEAWFHNSCSGLPVDLIPQVVKQAKLLLFRCNFCFLKKHTSTIAKLKEIIAETISEQLPVVVEKVTTQVNRADTLPDRGHLGPQCHPLPPFIKWTALINVMKLEFRVT